MEFIHTKAERLFLLIPKEKQKDEEKHLRAGLFMDTTQQACRMRASAKPAGSAKVAGDRLLKKSRSCERF